MVAGWGPAALLGGLLGGELSAGDAGAHALAEVLALHAELLTTARQDVPAGGPGALRPGAALCGSGHVSALARSQLLFCPLGFVKSLILRFNETLLTVAFECGAAEGAAFPAQAWHGVLEPGGHGTGFPRGRYKMFVLSVFDETEGAKALVFWSPEIRAASFSPCTLR